jgi:hypothetical protein
MPRYGRRVRPAALVELQLARDRQMRGYARDLRLGPPRPAPHNRRAGKMGHGIEALGSSSTLKFNF